MSDKTTTIRELRDTAEAFVNAREWYQFHNPKDLSMAVSVEAAELVEKFLWVSQEKSWQEIDSNREEIEHELADVIITAFNFARAANIDIASAVRQKLEHSNEKYPIAKAKGRSTKWDKL